MIINTDDYIALVIVDGKIISYIKSAVAGEDRLQYLLEKEKVCALNKQELYELQELERDKNENE